MTEYFLVPVNGSPGSNACCCYSLRSGGHEEYCDGRVCLSVCLSARIFQEPQVRASLNFVYMLPVAVAWPFSGGIIMRYVLPDLSMTLFSHSGPYGGLTWPQQHHSLQHRARFTPLRVVLVVSCPRQRRVLRLDESFVQGV